MHYELANLRSKLEKSENMNDYLKKKIEMHHITHGNIDVLMEMAQDLNMSKEEMETYKEKIMRTKKDITDAFLLSGLFDLFLNICFCCLVISHWRSHGRLDAVKAGKKPEV